MSLISDADREHDHLGPIIDHIRDFVTGSPNWIPNVPASWLHSQYYNFHRSLARIDKQLKDKVDEPLTKREVTVLLLALDTLFFNQQVFGDHMALDFEWMSGDLRGPRGDTIVENHQRTMLRVHPRLHATGLEMIGTFVHEMIHILIMEAFKTRNLTKWGPYCNKECKRVTTKLDGQGHGYYFLRLSSLIEQSSEKICGYPIDTGRMISILGDCKERWREEIHDDVPDWSYFQYWHNIHPFPGHSTAELAQEHFRKRWGQWTSARVNDEIA